ncbi:MAG: hypothetical protein ACI4RL_07880 [Ruminococcus sp.]
MIKATNRISKVLAIIFGALTCVTIFCIFTTFSNSGSYVGIHTKDGGKLFVTYAMNICGGILLAFGILAIFCLINRLSKKGLMIMSAVLFALFGLALAFVQKFYITVPITDSFYVNDYAISMVKGIHNVIDGSTVYFGKYANNNPVVILLFFVYSVADFFGIKDFVAVGRWVSSLAVMGGQVMFFFALKKFTGTLKTAVKFLLLSLMYPPLIFISSWVYTVSLCLPFMGGILLAGANIYRATKRYSIIINSAVAGVLTVLGYKIRPVVMILSIAFFICLVLWTLRDKIRIKKCLTVLVAGVVFAGSTFIGCYALDNHYYTGSNKNFPLIHWIAMGLTKDGTFDGNLSFENQNLDNTREMKENSKRHIEKAIDSYTPITFIQHLYFKHERMWGDGSMGYSSRMGSVCQSAPGGEYTIGLKADLMYIYCQMFWASLNILSLAFAVGFVLGKQRNYSLVFLLTMLGAYAFYMIWEVKSSYAPPFLFLIISMAVFGGEGLENCFDLSGVRVKKAGRIAYSTVAVFFVAVMIIAGPYFTNQIKTSSTPLISVPLTHDGFIENIAKEKKTVSQKFYTDTEFNCVRVNYDYTKTYIQGGKPPIYKFKLYDSNNNLLGKKVIDFSKVKIKDNKTSHPIRERRGRVIKQGYATIRLKNFYYPHGKEKFRIKIVGEGNYDVITIRTSLGEAIDTYPGQLRINGEKTEGDLRITVQQVKKETLTTIPAYVGLCLGIVILEFFIYNYLFCRKSKKKIRAIMNFFDKN